MPNQQLKLPGFLPFPEQPDTRTNRMVDADRSFHDWYRFVLSFPPHLVRTYFEEFDLRPDRLVFDPFAGTGTTLVEARKHGIKSVGLEANPFAHFASSVKTNWEIDPDGLREWSAEIAQHVRRELWHQGINDEQTANGSPKLYRLRTLAPDAEALLIRDSISALPLHKTLVLRDEIETHKDPAFYAHARLALANALVYSFSNLRFGPEIGVGVIKTDMPVLGTWLQEIEKMASDLQSIQGYAPPNASVHLADARELSPYLGIGSINGVITSPPYPNEKDYTRTTRLESVILGFINNRLELREFKNRLLRSNTRTVFKNDNDDRWIRGNSEIQQLAKEIEDRRLALGKTSGFERLYHRVTKLYFGGMARHLAELRPFLCDGAYLAYVVGDQASYFQVLIRTGELLAHIAEELGYKVVRIDLFRERFSTASRKYLREEAVILQWKG